MGDGVRSLVAKLFLEVGLQQRPVPGLHQLGTHLPQGLAELVCRCNQPGFAATHNLLPANSTLSISGPATEAPNLRGEEGNVALHVRTGKPSWKIIGPDLKQLGFKALSETC